MFFKTENFVFELFSTTKQSGPRSLCALYLTMLVMVALLE